MNILKTISAFLLVSVLSSCVCSCTDNIPASGNGEDIFLTFSYWEPGVYNELGTGLKCVIEEYEKLHPNIHIELVSQPVEEYQDWIKSQVVSNSLPDIQSNHTNYLVNQYRAGMIVDITDFMNAESAYTPGVPWKNSFIAERLEEANYGYQNSLCNIPFFGSELAIFYNKTVYEELGLSVPVTWREFMNNCEAIKNAGKTPIVMMTQKKDAQGWLGWEIGAGLNIEKFLADRKININNDNRISDYEFSRAIVCGDLNIAEDKDFQECYKNYIEHLAEYLSYCQDSLELEESVVKAIFLSGEAVHLNSGSWDVQSLLKNTGIDFEVGVFQFPYFTKEDTQYAGKGIGTAASQSIAVTKSVYGTEGKLEAAIDFLQYFTQKDVYQKFAGLTTQIPVVKGVEYDEDLECFIVDRYPPTDIISVGDEYVVYDILAGNSPALDSEFFRKKQEAALEKSAESLKNYGVSADNNYYMEEKQYGGEFKVQKE